MSTAQIERRLKALEAELADLKSQLRLGGRTPKKGWKQIVGSFAGDPLHTKVMRLGRQYREAQRPGGKRGKRR